MEFRSGDHVRHLSPMSASSLSVYSCSQCPLLTDSSEHRCWHAIRQPSFFPPRDRGSLFSSSSSSSSSSIRWTTSDEPFFSPSPASRSISSQLQRRSIVFIVVVSDATRTTTRRGTFTSGLHSVADHPGVGTDLCGCFSSERPNESDRRREDVQL